jgi:perosamine synthetase
MIKLYDPDINNSDIKSVIKALNNKELSGNTDSVKNFEKEISKFLGVKYVSSCSSGTAALHLALLSLDIGVGDEVIMPSLSYIATANSVSYVGAKPVFVDVDSKTWQIDTNKIEEKITKKTKALMPVHLYGVVPDLEKINYLASKYNLKIIHDSAEAMGSRYKNKFSTNYKDVSILSFFPNKIMTTGEGGALCTNNKEIYLRAQKLKGQGLQGKKEYVHSVIGYNYRLNSMSAALGIPQIKRIKSNISKKKDLFNKYKKYLEPINFEFQELTKNSDSSYWLIALQVPNKISRNDFKQYLYENKIETRNVFVPLHHQAPYRNLHIGENFNNSNNISKKGICLPSSPNLTDDEFSYIVNTINKFIKINS